MTVTIPPPQVRFTSHCVQRYIERLRPGTDPATVKRDLSGMHENMAFTVPPPVWLDGCLRHDADAFLVLGDDIAFILRRSPTDRESWRAVTCLVRGMPSDATRERRARRKRSVTGGPGRRVSPGCRVSG